MAKRTRVTFVEKPEHDGSRHLTDEQWLGLIAIVDDRPGWRWAMPAVAGEPARVLPPGEDLTHRFDADGSHYREPFEADRG